MFSMTFRKRFYSVYIQWTLEFLITKTMHIELKKLCFKIPHKIKFCSDVILATNIVSVPFLNKLCIPVEGDNL